MEVKYECRNGLPDMIGNTDTPMCHCVPTKECHETTSLRKNSASTWVATRHTRNHHLDCQRCRLLPPAHQFPLWRDPSSTGVTAFIGATIEFGIEVWNSDDMPPLIGTFTIVMEVKREDVGEEKRWIRFTFGRKYRRKFVRHFSSFVVQLSFGLAALPPCPPFLIQEWRKRRRVLDTTSRRRLGHELYRSFQVYPTDPHLARTFIMLESQHKWYKPESRSLGWNVGKILPQPVTNSWILFPPILLVFSSHVRNFIGGIEFTLCGALA
ncbi:uncharacterized protein LACBIDRAFT_304299 [Laccaria bicolor S238N-H82]|uniref:Predicted protein n=1 Tax=Laccaria bicolor (strain S238N-H82 / ATCC MYA-4686) TaxID=486041 RepID=B0DLB7_LACBS|nr:uncharacterized protein LACBIDRAFT_304299 [Laccaria bicolor S238N-H82]EDR04535.1 predicted protein [Laccaria bicolor S238N-H82]|eukprot:XP_001884707.1 predicted protein [Laccaria bicolor S238N-H82]